jgi:hypothetical protein
VAGLQESSVQALLSSQTIAVPRHDPPSHASFTVQALPSSQACVLFGKTQPVAGLQVSVVHEFPSLQTKGAPTWQAPPMQESPTVQALPSLHVFVSSFA